VDPFRCKNPILQSADNALPFSDCATTLQAGFEFEISICPWNRVERGTEWTLLPQKNYSRTVIQDPQAAHFFCRLSDRQSRAYGMPFPASLTEKDNVGSNKCSNKK
jgi:hypothetical protein